LYRESAYTYHPMSKTPKIKKAAKTYRFVVSVAGANSKSAAFRAILVAFANRSPDGCEFTTKQYRVIGGVILSKEVRK
jgi:hypothetical protein